MLVAGRLALALWLSFGETAVATSDPAGLYKEAVRLRNSGDLAGAARAYGQAYELLRAADLDHGNVVDSLLESVQLALEAYGRSPDSALLCEARRLVADYEEAVGARGGATVPEVVELRDQVAVTIERDGISCRVANDETVVKPAEAAGSGPGGTPSPVSPPDSTLKTPPVTLQPAPAGRSEGPRPPDPQPSLMDPRARRLRTGAYTSFGLTGVGLALLAAGIGTGITAEQAGQRSAIHGSDAVWLQEHLISRGSAANTLVIAGAVLATTATVTAVALLATSRRKSRMAFRTRFSPGGVHF